MQGARAVATRGRIHGWAAAASLLLLVAMMWPQIQGQIGVTGDSTANAGLGPRFKGDPVRLFDGQQLAALSDFFVDCRDFNAVHVECAVQGTGGPGATLQFLGGSASGGAFLPLPDPAALILRLTASTAFDITVGAAFLKAQISAIGGTFQPGQGFTVIATPFVAPGPTSPSTARPAYYDRNASAKTFYTDTGPVGPHATATRWSYLVPSGRRAYLEQVFLMTLRITAAASAAVAQCFIQYTPAAGVVGIPAYSLVTSNGVNDRDKQVLGTVGYMGAGDLLACVDNDNSTGGSVEFFEYAKVVEFDA